MTEAEYLAWEEVQTEKHELVNGEILAMSGVSDAHDRIQVNLLAGLHRALRGGPCRVRGPELRVNVTASGLYAYPDLTVVCGQHEFAPTRPVSLLNPKLLVEVLSESTADYDLGPKAAHYRMLPSADTLAFIDSRRRYIQLQRRNPNGTWTLSEHLSGEVTLLGQTLSFDEVYDTVELEPG